MLVFAVLAAVLAGAVTGTFVTFVLTGTLIDELALASGMTGAFASTLAFVFGVVVSAGVSGLVERTETPPFNAGIESISADNIKIVAVTIVVFDKTVAVPREP